MAKKDKKPFKVGDQVTTDYDGMVGLPTTTSFVVTGVQKSDSQSGWLVLTKPVREKCECCNREFPTLPQLDSDWYTKA